MLTHDNKDVTVCDVALFSHFNHHVGYLTQPQPHCTTHFHLPPPLYHVKGPSLPCQRPKRRVKTRCLGLEVSYFLSFFVFVFFLTRPFTARLPPLQPLTSHSTS